jgi:hypothetical protein
VLIQPHFEKKGFMKKLLLLLQILAIAALYSPASFASGGHGHGHGWKHHKKKHHHHRRPVEIHHYHEEIHHYPAPQVGYVPAPPRRYDQRSTSGLVGGALGSALGYEIGKGDPVASGLGAAAGAYIGNGVGRR